MKLVILHLIFLRAGLSTVSGNSCYISFKNFELSHVRMFITCSTACAGNCGIKKFQNELCTQQNPNWKIERVSRKGCKKYTNSFYLFKGYGIVGNNADSRRMKIAKCKLVCIRAKRYVCKTIDFTRNMRMARNNCFPSSITYVEAPVKDRQVNYNGWSLLTRKCKRY